MIVAAMVTTPASAQGLFDFLFAPQRPAYEQRPIVAYAPDQPYYQPRDTHTFQPRRKRVKLSPSVEKAVAATEGPPKKAPPPEVGQGPLGPFINDPTLRAGDIVVTERGLMVYRGGGGGAHHSPSEFVSVAAAKSLVGKRGRDLASIEQANRKAPVEEVETQTASADTNKQASAADPKPHRKAR